MEMKGVFVVAQSQSSSNTGTTSGGGGGGGGGTGSGPPLETQSRAQPVSNRAEPRRIPRRGKLTWKIFKDFGSCVIQLVCWN